MESTLFYSPRFLDVNNFPKKAFNGLCHQCPNSAHNIIIIVIQLFRERISEKVHATIAKSIVGSFDEFTVLQRNLKEWHKRPWTYVCEC